MKKLIVIVIAAIVSLGYAPVVHAEAGSFNQQSYDKVAALSQAIEAFTKVSAEGELSLLTPRVATIHEKAAALAAYDATKEVPGDQAYAAAAGDLQTVATKLELVSKKMNQAAIEEDDSLFVSYQKEYNGAVTDLKSAITDYSVATEAATERIKLEQMMVIGVAVLTGIITIAVWLWASSGDTGHRARARARRLIAIASLLPFIGALAALGLYLLHMVSGYFIWLPPVIGVVVLLLAWVMYLVRRKKFVN